VDVGVGTEEVLCAEGRGVAAGKVAFVDVFAGAGSGGVIGVWNGAWRSRVGLIGRGSCRGRVTGEGGC
jgi:hypothetical protein